MLDPARCDEIHSLASFRGALHAGTWRLGRIARFDEPSRRWQQVGRLGDSTEVMALNVYNGMLYAASIPRARRSGRDFTGGLGLLRACTSRDRVLRHGFRGRARGRAGAHVSFAKLTRDVLP